MKRDFISDKVFDDLNPLTYIANVLVKYSLNVSCLYSLPRAQYLLFLSTLSGCMIVLRLPQSVVSLVFRDLSSIPQSRTPLQTSALQQVLFCFDTTKPQLKQGGGGSLTSQW